MSKTDSGSGTRGSGYHTEGQIKKVMRPARARDDLPGAFAGDENRGPAAKQKKDSQHSTNVKSRKTEASKNRTPIR